MKDVLGNSGASRVTEGESSGIAEVRGDPDVRAMTLGEFLRLVKEFGPDPEAADAVEAEIRRARSGV